MASNDQPTERTSLLPSSVSGLSRRAPAAGGAPWAEAPGPPDPGIDSVNQSSEVIFSDSGFQSSEELQNAIRAQTGSSWYASVFLVVNAALGAGLLNFPKAYDQSGGILVAVTVQALLIAFVVISMLVLVYCSGLHQSATYQDVVQSMCGKGMQMLCSATVSVYCFGTCITFFIIIGDQWDKFFTFAYGPAYCDFWYMSRTFTMVTTCVLFVLPLCFPRRIDFLKYISAVGVAAVAYCVLLVTVKYFIGPNDPGPVKTSPTNWTDVFMVVPVICFSYQCHLSVIPIYACMRKRTVREFSKTLAISLLICVFAYTGTASFGYLTFGSKVNDDILLSYEPTVDILVAVIVVAAKMYTTYPILLFVGRCALDSVYIYVRKLTPEAVAAGEKTRRILTVLLWFSTTLLLAVFVPNIGIVISLLGGLAAIFIFVFPGLCLLQIVVVRGPSQGQESQQRPLVYRVLLPLAVLFTVLGAFIFGLVTAQSLWNIVVSGPHKPDGVFRSICP